MNKVAIKNFAVEARKKLIASVKDKAGRIGITKENITESISKGEGYAVFPTHIGIEATLTGKELKQRENLVNRIKEKSYESVMEEVAYTWFNRIIAVRFMEVKDYLPSRIRVLSSETKGKFEPDIVTQAPKIDLELTDQEIEEIISLKERNELDKLFRMLFIKQCNELGEVLPDLFENTSKYNKDYTELLLNISYANEDGVIRDLMKIDEIDFLEAVEIIGWMYQYYNTELKEETFALLKKNVKIIKERIPAVTQLFTPDWIVRYMVENSLGRLWTEGHPNNNLKANWKYYLDEAKQEPEVQAQLEKIRAEYQAIKPVDIKVIDPCMGSGHILVYNFDVLMQIYESCGYTQRDAAKSILENNLYGLDIDDRAYQLAYFAVMMKARQYNRYILNSETKCRVYAIQESNGINRNHLQYLGANFTDKKEWHKIKDQVDYLLDIYHDAKEYGSILSVDRKLDFEKILVFIDDIDIIGQMTIVTNGIEDTQKQLRQLIEIAEVMAQKYDVVLTNPPYMGNNSFNGKLSYYVKNNYPDSKGDLFAVFVERCNKLTSPFRYQAMITQHSWMFLSSFEKLRDKMLVNDIVTMAHLGARAFEEIAGEIVQTTTFISRKSDIKRYSASYIRLVDHRSQKEKETAFLGKKAIIYSAKENYPKIPGTPIAYWVSENIANAFVKGKSITNYVDTFQGIITGDNDKFLRIWTEVNSKKIPFHASSMKDVDLYSTYWIPYNKGGEFRKWYGIQDYVVYWKNGPDDKTRGKKSFQEYYLREYVAWSYTVSNSIAARYYPTGFLWDVRGSGIMDKANLLYYLQALICSKIGITFFKVNNSTLSCQVENIIQLPIIVDENQKNTVDKIVQCNVEISCNEWDSFETSWDFVRHPLLTYRTESNRLIDAYVAWEQFADSQFVQLKANEEELNRIFIDIYRLHDELTPEVEDKNVTIRKADLQRDIRSFVSYAVGCMFGRYSLDVEGFAYAGGEWNDSKYATFIPDKDNIIPISDEEYFGDDIVSRFARFVKVVYGEDSLEENLDFIANALGNKGSTSREIIRNYFIKDFYKDHVKTYQKRPIYWLFESGKENGFKALIYLHRYNEDTVGRVRADYLHKTQSAIENTIAHCDVVLESNAPASDKAKAVKQKGKLVKQFAETRIYDQAIAHIAHQRISLDLDDGVVANYAKFQDVVVSSEGKKAVKVNLLGKI